ncbi:hypothetical protein CHARACLAT_000404 [Characodon lateralis]|uniref:Uncharacterized protein n=1 Tax=Characodon lateralis TaxID=208331 RepID=A0ABU7E6G2_9TELE|nr:hypothetical protein [Characodon lateralis]
MPNPPSPTWRVNADLTLCRGEEGGEEAPLHWTEDAKAALKTNKTETQHYYAILNQPTSLFPLYSGPLFSAPPIFSSPFNSLSCDLVGVFYFCFFLLFPSFGPDLLHLAHPAPFLVPQVSLSSSTFTFFQFYCSLSKLPKV